MDYRPISLLQTSYKVFAKVLATRLQLSLPRAISDSQQGFFHGRKMTNTVMMMMAHLATARELEEVSAAQSRCILLLDFRKAYDTVDREFRVRDSPPVWLGRAIHWSNPTYSHRHDSQFRRKRRAFHSSPGPIRDSARVPASTSVIFAKVISGYYSQEKRMDLSLRQ